MTGQLNEKEKAARQRLKDSEKYWTMEWKGLPFETEKISLAEQFALIDKTVVGEELVNVSFATTERLALGEFLLRGTHKVTPCQQFFYGHSAVQVFRKSETTFASWR